MEINSADKSRKLIEGKINRSNGDVFAGSSFSDKNIFIGTMTFANGNKYEGQLEKVTFEGNGTYRWINGDVYFGTFDKNIPSGFGVKRFSNGDLYQGFWQDGKFHDNGTYTWSNGDVYQGEYQSGNKEGYGEYIYNTSQSRARYEGEFVNDKPNGNGVLIYKDGCKFDGTFHNGEPNGSGVLTFTRHKNKRRNPPFKYEGKKEIYKAHLLEPLSLRLIY